MVKNKIDKNWVNFQRNLMPPPKCENCFENCEILYDSYHDQYFSENCGLVVREMGVNLIFFDEEWEE